VACGVEYLSSCTSEGVENRGNKGIVGGKLRGRLARFFSSIVPGPPFYRGVGGFMAMWKKVAIVVVAWAASVLVYVEFFKAR
jgi:hypothetical protein